MANNEKIFNGEDVNDLIMSLTKLREKEIAELNKAWEIRNKSFLIRMFEIYHYQSKDKFEEYMTNLYKTIKDE
jgi:hypothetical protein